MDFDTAFGCLVLLVSLTVSGYLVFWSRRTIDMIHRRNLKSARQIVQELTNGR